MEIAAFLMQEVELSVWPDAVRQARPFAAIVHDLDVRWFKEVGQLMGKDKTPAFARLRSGSGDEFRVAAFQGISIGTEVMLSGQPYLVMGIDYAAPSERQLFAAELEKMAAARGGWFGFPRRKLEMTAVEVTDDRITWALR